MSTPASNLLRFPSGSAKLFLQEARNHQLIVQDLNQLYDRWGYLPVQTPLVDYSRTYDGLISEKDRQRVYHLVDRDGEILMLRWDLTLFLVKQVRSLLGEAPLPLRLCYADTILRHQEAEDISHNEFYQTGIELIGSAGPQGDLEVLLLLNQTLSSLGLRAAVHLGSRGLFSCAFPDLETSVSTELAQAISLRDFGKARALLTKASFPQIDLWIDLFRFMGKPAELRALLTKVANNVPSAFVDECTALVDFAETAMKIEEKFDIHIDLSELGGQDYYSGMVFKAYVDGIDSAVASGGRYDRLLERLGIPIPAAGFSIMLSKISHQAQSGAKTDDTIQALGTTEPFSASAFAERYQKAQKLRATGKRVTL